MLVTGDFGLCFSDDKTFKYNLDWFAKRDFTTLFVDGNHENFDMLYKYKTSDWNGGQVAHVVKDKVLWLKRGQVFTLNNKKLFTMGGASSHDVTELLDENDKFFKLRKKELDKNHTPYRVDHKSWWKEELPSEQEIKKAYKNLEKHDFKVDYVFTHCASNKLQNKLNPKLKSNRLTDFFDNLEDKLSYKHWYFGHYHKNETLDDKHTVLYDNMITLQ